MQNVSRHAVRLHLLSYVDKELTKLTCTCFWLVDKYINNQCVIWFDKKKFQEKSHKMTRKIPLLLQILGCAPLKPTSNMPMHTIIYIYTIPPLKVNYVLCANRFSIFPHLTRLFNMKVNYQNVESLEHLQSKYNELFQQCTRCNSFLNRT